MHNQNKDFHSCEDIMLFLENSVVYLLEYLKAKDSVSDGS